MVKIINKISLNIVKYCFVLFVLLYSFANIFFTVRLDNLANNDANYLFGFNIFNTIILIVLLLIIVLLLKKEYLKIKSKSLLLVFLFICFAIGLYWILSNHSSLVEYDDAYNVFRSALSVSKGDYSPLGYHTYLNNYPNNMGMFTYDFLMIKLFGETKSLYVIRFINLAFVLLGYLFIYKITNVIFNDETTNNTLVFIMFGSMQFVFYSFFVYGNCISYSLGIVSIYYLLKYLDNAKTSNLIISNVSVILSIIIKMNSVIILVAEIIYLIIHIINTKKVILCFSILALLLCTYIGTTGLQKYWSSKVNYDYSETKLPTICWVAYGVNYDMKHPGHYTNEFEMFHYEEDFNQMYTSQKAKQFISMAINNFKERPSLALEFYSKKFLVSWANPQYEAFDQFRELPLTKANESIIGGKINDFIEEYWDAYSTIISIGLLSYMIIYFKKMTLKELIGVVVVLGGFFFHAFWEVKAIYLYQYFMLLWPYASYGLVLLFNRKKDI